MVYEYKPFNFNKDENQSEKNDYILQQTLKNKYNES